MDYRWQKLAGLLVFFLGSGGVFLGVFQTRNYLLRSGVSNQDFKEKMAEINELKESAADRWQTQLLEFKEELNKDSDGDGLTDRDELEKYSTSPYLADSDSDGVTDQLEIKAGTDPNCAPGEDCGLGGVKPNLDPQLLLELQGGASLNKQSDLGSDLSPQDLRQMLLNTGQVEADLLDQMSDQDLKTSFDQFLKRSPTSSGLTGQAGQTEAAEIDWLSLSEAELRAKLIEVGLPKNQLENYTFQQLRTALEELGSDLK